MFKRIFKRVKPLEYYAPVAPKRKRKKTEDKKPHEDYYFVSYFFSTGDNNWGLGSAYITVNSDIFHADSVVDSLAKPQWKSMVIINYKKVSYDEYVLNIPTPEGEK